MIPGDPCWNPIAIDHMKTCRKKMQKLRIQLLKAHPKCQKYQAYHILYTVIFSGSSSKPSTNYLYIKHILNCKYYNIANLCSAIIEYRDHDHLITIHLAALLTQKGWILWSLNMAQGVELHQLCVCVDKHTREQEIYLHKQFWHSDSVILWRIRLRANYYSLSALISVGTCLGLDCKSHKYFL